MPSAGSGSSETLPGMPLGTPAYMSPEQAEGRLDRMGPRSDVYSLGATLYCLLIGKPPFAGEVADVLRAVQRGEVRPPRQLDPGIDPALEAICLQAMAHRPEDRYPSGRALADDLDRWMADEPVSAWHEPLDAPGAAMGAEESHRGDCRGRGPDGRRGRPARGAGRADPGQGRPGR